MSSEMMIAWFMTVFPLTFSPGPANILFGATGTRFGFLRTVPLMLGVNTMFTVQSVLVGLGMGHLLLGHPVLLTSFKYGGVIYMLYLAYKFFHSSLAEEIKKVKPPTFWEGCVLQTLNFKALTIPILMFSQFLHPNRPKLEQIIVMTAMLIGLNLACGSVWIGGGNAIKRITKSEQAMKVQGYVFGGLLGMVAVWMAFR